MSDLALVPANDSALARAITGGSFLPSDVPAYLLAEEDEQGDLQGIEPRTTLVKYNGKYGTFYGPEQAKDEGPKEMVGVALARLQTAALFRPTDPAKRKQALAKLRAESQAYREGDAAVRQAKAAVEQAGIDVRLAENEKRAREKRLTALGMQIQMYFGAVIE